MMMRFSCCRECPMTSELKAPRVGLVLEGGGAKGAYAIGCLRALYDNGIRFDAVAGTSVGALNAAIVATNKIVFGEEFWSSLTFRRVFKTNLFFWFAMPAQLLGLLAQYPFSPFGSNVNPKKGIVALYSWAAALLLFIFALPAALKPSIAYEILLEFTLPATLIIAPIAILCSIPYVVRLVGWSGFDPSPLALTIRNELAEATYSIPTYATLSIKKDIFDPDFPNFWVTPFAPIAIPSEINIPVYARIDRIAPKWRELALLASAALPFGIFPSITLGPSEYIDGGLADNAPIFPLIEEEQCDVIVIIRLQPSISETWYEAHWKEVDRNLRVAELSMDECRKSYHQRPIFFPSVMNVPYREFPASVRTIVISPKTSLGGFLSGTMNFRYLYSTKLMKQGYQDGCLAVCEASALLLSQPSSISQRIYANPV